MTAFALPNEHAASQAAADGGHAAEPTSQSTTPDAAEIPAAETQADGGGGAADATSSETDGGDSGATGGTGGTGATGGTGGTGSTGGTGAGSEGGGSGVVTPGDPATPTIQDPVLPVSPDDPVSPTTPIDESPGAGTETGDETTTGELPAAGDGALGAEDAAAQRRGEVAAQLIADARPDSGGAGTVSDAVERATRSNLAGVQAGLVITRIVEKIPGWMRWAFAVLVGVALFSWALLAREMHRRREAEQDAMVDVLTGISNRKAFERRLDLEWKRAERYGRSLGLLLLDLDGFKKVNDIHGHAAGDVVLREVAERLDQRMRDTDLVARIGGDEFAVICPETGAHDLESISTHLAEAATHDLTNSVGISIGVAEYRPGDPSMDELIDRADQAMYRVKRAAAVAA